MKKERRRNLRNTALWLHFTITIFDIFLIVSILLFVLALAADRLGFFRQHSPSPLFLILMMLIISVISATSISALIAKRVLMSISEMSRAAQEVAKGNFDVKLSESNHILEIYELQHNFNIMTSELRGIETLRNDFIVNVSHEFKTPLAAIDGYATLIQDPDMPEDERLEYIGMIIESARQLSRLTGNILKLSKLENQELVYDKKEYSLDEQIRQAVLWLEREWSPKDINFEINLEECKYYGNSDLMMQIWINLIGNAVKFTDNGGNISISLVRCDDKVIFTITDNGIGMDEKTKEHIFEKFYQADGTRGKAGNGLGLALVKRITDMCKGEVSVESSPGVGSQFKVVLPLNEQKRER